ncbi:MAG: hypothetical protein N2035_10410, partial [Chthoniobacterales bacterium]|nr:hypothetical protein [Chthoniobacterales bacterium]
SSPQLSAPPPHSSPTHRLPPGNPSPPTFPPRHFYRGSLHGAKLKQNDSPENQLADELARIGITSPVPITRIPINSNPDHHQTHWDIVRTPSNNPAFENAILTNAYFPGTRKERRIGFFFHLTFEHPITIPRPSATPPISAWVCLFLCPALKP